MQPRLWRSGSGKHKTLKVILLWNLWKRNALHRLDLNETVSDPFGISFKGRHYWICAKGTTGDGSELFRRLYIPLLQTPLPTKLRPGPLLPPRMTHITTLSSSSTLTVPLPIILQPPFELSPIMPIHLAASCQLNTPS